MRPIGLRHTFPQETTSTWTDLKGISRGEGIAAKLLMCSTGPYRVIHSTGHTVVIDRDGLPKIASTDGVSCAPRSPMAYQPQETAPVPAITTALPPTSVAMLGPLAPATLYPMVRPLHTVLIPSGRPESIAPLSRDFRADAFGPSPAKAPPLVVNVAPRLRADPVVFSRTDRYDNYMPEHYDHSEYVVDLIVSAGPGKNGKVL